MALGDYVKTVWASRIREFANRFTLNHVSGDTYDLARVEGEITQEGVTISPTKLNNAEDKIDELDKNAVQKPSAAVGNNIAVFDVNQNKLKDGGKSIAELTRFIVPSDDVIAETDLDVTFDGVTSGTSNGLLARVIFQVPYPGRYRIKGEIRTTDSEYERHAYIGQWIPYPSLAASPVRNIDGTSPDFFWRFGEISTTSEEFIPFTLDAPYVIQKYGLIYICPVRHFTAHAVLRNIKLCGVFGDADGGRLWQQSETPSTF